MLVLCVCGVPPNVIDTPQWKNLMNVLNPAYKPTSAEIFVNKWIPKEAAWVRKKQNEILKKSANITLSFDGGSTRQDSVALVHATPGDTRESFFIDGHVSNRERHTAEWYADRLKEVRISALITLLVMYTHSTAVCGTIQGPRRGGCI